MNDKDQCCASERIPSLTDGMSKPKKFNDCGIEEKVARLHGEIVNLRQQLRWSSDSQSRMATKLFALERHQHSSSGDCMLKIEDINRGNNEISGSLCSSIDYLA